MVFSLLLFALLLFALSLFGLEPSDSLEPGPLALDKSRSVVH